MLHGFCDCIQDQNMQKQSGPSWMLFSRSCAGFNQGFRIELGYELGMKLEFYVLTYQDKNDPWSLTGKMHLLLCLPVSAELG